MLPSPLSPDNSLQFYNLRDSRMSLTPLMISLKKAYTHSCPDIDLLASTPRKSIQTTSIENITPKHTSDSTIQTTMPPLKPTSLSSANPTYDITSGFFAALIAAQVLIFIGLLILLILYIVHKCLQRRLQRALERERVAWVD